MSRRHGSGRADRHFDFASHQEAAGLQEARAEEPRGQDAGAARQANRRQAEAIRRLRGRVE